MTQPPSLASSLSVEIFTRAMPLFHTDLHKRDKARGEFSSRKDVTQMKEKNKNHQRCTVGYYGRQRANENQQAVHIDKVTIR